MRKLFIPLLIAVLSISTWSFTFKTEGIQWYSWEQATELAKNDKKKLLVFIYSENCNWCKLMEDSTFNEPHIASYINENYYAVKFDAQHKEPISFKGEEYNYVEQKIGGYHEFAAALTGGKLVFPMSVFVDEEGRVLQSIQGYKEPEVFEMILTFYGDNYHMERPWKNHVRSYVPLTRKSGTIYISDE